MRVIVRNWYDDTSHAIEGAPDKILHELLKLYPFLNPYESSIEDQVEHLNSAQAFEAVIQYDSLGKSERAADKPNDHVVSAMLGHHAAYEQALSKARFLAGGSQPTVDPKVAFREFDGDVERAALRAHGLEVTDSNIKALRGVLVDESLHKTQPLANDIEVHPGHPSAIETAEKVQRAIRDDFSLPIKLHGKHSEGTFVVRDDDSGETWLLKPGSGPQNPAKGEGQEPVSQSQREAAFYYVADKVFGLGDYYSETFLLTLNGKEYAAIKLLPWNYQTVDSLKNSDAGKVKLLLHPYLTSGVLHKWAIVDAVLGNPDRHAQNMMFSDRRVVLIDHGSAMSGEAFDPGTDKAAFIPYYLRAWSGVSFTDNPDDKLKYLPRVSHSVAEDIADWLESVDQAALQTALVQFGVNPEPAVKRLAQLKLAVSQGMPADLAVNEFWVA